MKRTISFFVTSYLSFGANGSVIIQDGVNEADGIVSQAMNYIDVSDWQVYEGTFDALDMVVLKAAVAENFFNVPEAISVSLLGLIMVGFGFARRNKRAVNQNGSYRRRFGA